MSQPQPPVRVSWEWACQERRQGRGHRRAFVEVLERSLRERFPEELTAYAAALQRVREGHEEGLPILSITDPRYQWSRGADEIDPLMGSGRAEAIGALLWLTRPEGPFSGPAGVAVAHLGRVHPDALYQALAEAGLLQVPWGLGLLARAGDGRAVPGLARLLAEGRHPRWAIERLGKVRTPEALAVIIEHRAHPDDGVRLAVALALDKREDKAATEALQQLTHDPDCKVRYAARCALDRRDRPLRRFPPPPRRLDALEVLLDWLAERAGAPLRLRPASADLLRSLTRKGAPEPLLALYQRVRNPLPGLVPSPDLQGSGRLLPPALCLAHSDKDGWPFAAGGYRWPHRWARRDRRQQLSPTEPVLVLTPGGQVALKTGALYTPVAQDLEALLTRHLQALMARGGP